MEDTGQVLTGHAHSDLIRLQPEVRGAVRRVMGPENASVTHGSVNPIKSHGTTCGHLGHGAGEGS